MKTILRPVRFEEVDAAGLLFFPVFAAYAHEAMAALFDDLEGGYPAMIMKRRVGLPAVAMTSQFLSPLRFGDVAEIATSVTRLGNRSAEIHYDFKRKADGVVCSTMSHTVVCTDLDVVKSCAMPPDIRAALEAHLVRPKS